MSTIGIVFTAYHGKKILDLFTRIGIWARVGGAVLVAAVVVTVLVPGISVSINPSAFLDVASKVWRMIPWSEMLSFHQLY